jgi:heme-degrading monooxygenase HmoA
MHARITSYEVQPGRLDERLRHSREVVAPLNRAQPGYLGRLVLVNHQTSRTMVIALWEDEADRQRADADPRRESQLGRHHFAAGEVVLEDFEVASDELPRP